MSFALHRQFVFGRQWQRQQGALCLRSLWSLFHWGDDVFTLGSPCRGGFRSWSVWRKLHGLLAPARALCLLSSVCWDRCPPGSRCEASASSCPRIFVGRAKGVWPFAQREPPRLPCGVRVRLMPSVRWIGFCMTQPTSPAIGLEGMWGGPVYGRREEKAFILPDSSFLCHLGRLLGSSKPPIGSGRICPPCFYCAVFQLFW